MRVYTYSPANSIHFCDATCSYRLNLKSRGIEQEDKIKRYRGATLSEHCTNLSSVFFCRYNIFHISFFCFCLFLFVKDANYFNRNNMVLTGSSRGSMCLHGVPRTTPRRRVLSLEIHLFLDTPLSIYKNETHCHSNFNSFVFAAYHLQGSCLPMV